jgi:hypothetical protein
MQHLRPAVRHLANMALLVDTHGLAADLLWGPTMTDQLCRKCKGRHHSMGEYDHDFDPAPPEAKEADDWTFSASSRDGSAVIDGFVRDDGAFAIAVRSPANGVALERVAAIRMRDWLSRCLMGRSGAMEAEQELPVRDTEAMTDECKHCGLPRQHHHEAG